MVKGDGVDWVWVKPGEKLGAYKTRVGAVLNKSDMHSSSMVSKVKSIFHDNFSGATKGTLTAEVCIWGVQKYTPEKQRIPYAGGRAAQAGMGVEVVLVDMAKKLLQRSGILTTRDTTGGMLLKMWQAIFQIMWQNINSKAAHYV